MPINSNYFKIGVFTIAGVALFLAGLFAFGLGGSLFKKRLECVTYFNRSVQGLMVDSSVKFRGFTVGKVSSISLASVERTEGQPVVKVIFEINPTLLAGDEESVEAARHYIVTQRDRGLKVFLNFQGITGIGFLDMDYSDEATKQEPQLLTKATKQAAARNLVFIPNAPGQIMEISESASRIVKSLSEVHFASIGRDINVLVQTVDKAVTDLDTSRISTTLDSTMKEIRTMAAGLTVFLNDLDQTIKGGTDTNIGQEMENSLKQFRQTLKRLDQALGSSQGNLPATLDNLRVMSENLRELSELLKNQPSQLVFGEPPKEVKPRAATGTGR
ncbi:MlaD family protein [Deltaproteobacteria bacterium OttesenSCG-928-M10]|nr:MlaD family protein [Deltaproteobacteria bacterium OttesenSCG-928-M10]